MTRLANLRDLGGLPMVGGGETRTGVLYRSDAPYVGDDAPTEVPWPPALAIDLRSGSESARSRAGWTDATTVVNLPLSDAGDLSDLPARAGLAEIYESIVIETSKKISTVIELVAQTEGPTLVHCAAGKDRTGVLVAALLLVAGVEPEAVVRDYRATADVMAAVLTRLSSAGGVATDSIPTEFASAPEAAVRSVIDLVTNHPGGPRQWVVDLGTPEDVVDRFCDRIRGASALTSVNPPG